MAADSVVVMVADNVDDAVPVAGIVVGVVGVAVGGLGETLCFCFIYLRIVVDNGALVWQFEIRQV